MVRQGKCILVHQVVPKERWVHMQGTAKTATNWKQQGTMPWYSSRGCA